MRLEQIEGQIEQQFVLAEIISKALDNLTKVGKEQINIHRIQTRLDALRNQWKKFSQIHDEINAAISEADRTNKSRLRSNKYFTENIYVATLECYLEVAEQMNILREQYQKSSSRSATPEGQVMYSQGPKLPRLDLPKFNGTPSEWLSFKDMFTSLVLTNNSISPVGKLQYLKTSLVGSAAHLLKNTTTTADNFQGAWESLISFYENKRLLVDSAIHAILTVKRLTRESAQEMEQLYGSVTQAVRTLKTLGRPVDSFDDFLVHIVTGKLDSESVKAWEQQLGCSKEPPSWKSLSDFLMTRMLTLKAFEKSKGNSRSKNEVNSVQCHFAGQDEKNNLGGLCLLCSEKHHLYKCSEFQNKTVQQRKEFVAKNNLCFNCLGHHRIKNCQSSRRCTKCAKKHHSLLHQLTSTEKKENQNVRVRDKANDFVNARALLDQGSTVSLVSEKFVNHLKLSRQSRFSVIVGIGGQLNMKTRGVVTLEIRPHFESEQVIVVEAHILPKLTSTIPSSQIDSSWPHLQKIQLADPLFFKPGSMDIILGVEVHAYLIEENIIKGPPCTPIAQRTKFGWIISGATVGSTVEKMYQGYSCLIDQELYTLIEKFWKQEECPQDSNGFMTPEEEECERFFQLTHTRDTTGRYIVRLPLKESIERLGDSQQNALQVLSSLKRRLCADDSYYQLYKEFLEEYLRLNHMERVNPDSPEPDRVFYLPHHGVIRKSSLTTKLRVVFNGSKPSSTGISLNDILHTGKKLQTDLLDVLLWFRKFKYVFAADIEKMYRQVRVHPDDWSLQRIMWINDHGKVEKFQLTTVTYGLACAPFLAMRAIAQLILDEGQRFPLAVDVLQKGRYVDDVFGGADSVEELQEIIKQVDQLCMAGGFPLQKWVSNHLSSLDILPSERLSTTIEQKIKEQSLVHALGLSWNRQTDTFQFSEESMKPSPKSTKRAILSHIAQLFDPLGLISPVIIRAKILLQHLWLLKVNWDDELPKQLEERWLEFKTQLQELSQITIPRWIGYRSNSQLEIHGFSDASQEAMAAVVYIRAKDLITSQITTVIVASKTKVAPLKRLTIPRLELSAATLLVKLTAHIIKILNLEQVPVYLWTDSSIVHTWLSSHPSRWKEYVHNRVCYIQETLPTAQWRFVPGQNNPADCASRGLTPQQLSQHLLWWEGPDWLKQPQSQWPSFPAVNFQSENLEERQVQVCVALQKELPPWEVLLRFSSVKRLFRVTALCRKFMLKLRKFSVPNFIVPEEIEWARNFWILQVQRSAFMHELQLIEKNEPLPKSSPLHKFVPFLDSNGIIRVGGRLQNSPLDYSAKHPAILPRHNHLSQLLISEAHLRTLHGGTQVTLMDLRNSYWILGGRSPIRSYILKCVRCARYRQERPSQLMGQLPVTRTSPSRPFFHSGVDYAGPLLVKSWKGRKARTYKSYIVLFVCFATSAIHIELVTDYTAEGFIAAYKRFVSRRGICASLTSDCGTNLVGADAELRKLFTQSSEELGKLATLLANDGTKWQFNPPGTPHFGGKWEAGVKSVKFHLKRVIGDTLLTYEELTTLLNQIEAVLNSRPLCPLTEDIEDLSALTPGHFIIGQPLTTIPEPSLATIKVSRLSRWQLTRHMLEKFWNLWSKSCLQRYHALSKWTEKSNKITKGMLVLVIDERYPPSKWPLARITELHPGPDGLTRVVTVKTQSSIFKRSITKLCPLPVETNTL